MVTYKFNKDIALNLEVTLDEAIDLDYFYEMKEEMAWNMFEQIKHGINWFN